MVKEKKLTKSSIAIIVLALLLVASLIMGMTGAWFTASKNADQTATVDFGTVALTSAGIADGHMTIVRNVDTGITKAVDGDTWTIDGLTISNASDVAIFYAVQYEFDLYNAAGTQLIAKDVRWDGQTDDVTGKTDEQKAEIYATLDHIRTCFTGLTEDNIVLGFLNAESVGNYTNLMAGKTFIVSFDSEGKANGHPTDYMLKANVKVTAVQARHMDTAETLMTQLDLAAQYDADDLEDASTLTGQAAALLADHATAEVSTGL